VVKRAGRELFPGSSLSGELLEVRALAPYAQIPGQLLQHERIARQLALNEAKFDEQLRKTERDELLGGAARVDDGSLIGSAGVVSGGQKGGKAKASAVGGRGRPVEVPDMATGILRTMGVGPKETWTARSFSPSIQETEEAAMRDTPQLRKFLEANKMYERAKSIERGEVDPTQQDIAALDALPYSTREGATERANPWREAARFQRWREAKEAQRQGAPSSSVDIFETDSKRGKIPYLSARPGDTGLASSRLIKDVEDRLKRRELVRPDILERIGGKTPDDLVEFVDILTGPLNRDIYSQISGRQLFKGGQEELRKAFNDVASYIQRLRELGDEVGAARMAKAMTNEYKYEEAVRKDFVSRVYNLLRQDPLLKGRSDANIMTMAEGMSRSDTKPIVTEDISNAQARKIKRIGNVVGLSELNDKKRQRKKAQEAYATQRSAEWVDTTVRSLEDQKANLDPDRPGDRAQIDEINARIADAKKGPPEEVAKVFRAEGLLDHLSGGGQAFEGPKERAAARDEEETRGLVENAIAARARADESPDDLSLEARATELENLASARDQAFGKRVDTMRRQREAAGANQITPEMLADLVRYFDEQMGEGGSGQAYVDARIGTPKGRADLLNTYSRIGQKSGSPLILGGFDYDRLLGLEGEPEPTPTPRPESAEEGLPVVTTKAEFDSLRPGERYVEVFADGQRRTMTKPKGNQ